MVAESDVFLRALVGVRLVSRRGGVLRLGAVLGWVPLTVEVLSPQCPKNPCWWSFLSMGAVSFLMLVCAFWCPEDSRHLISEGPWKWMPLSNGEDSTTSQNPQSTVKDLPSGYFTEKNPIGVGWRTFVTSAYECFRTQLFLQVPEAICLIKSCDKNAAGNYVSYKRVRSSTLYVKNNLLASEGEDSMVID